MVILHSDLNNFYATVERSLFPELAGKPVAVCGDKEARHGIVLAKSEEAKAFGVRTGDVIWEAKRKCPGLIIRPVRFPEYVKRSRQVRDIYARFTDLIEPFGIDECWLDVTHSKIFGNGEQIAEKIRRAVKEELNLTVSVGVSFNKVFAKLASDLKNRTPLRLSTARTSKRNCMTFRFPICCMSGARRRKNCAAWEYRRSAHWRRLIGKCWKMFSENGAQHFRRTRAARTKRLCGT